MVSLARTPEPPYVAVIFTAVRTPAEAGYDAVAAEMDRMAARQNGYLGHDSARSDVGITVSYWRDEDAARAWKQVAEHLSAQRRGRADWYVDYEVRIATVHRAYSMTTSALTAG